MVSDPGACKATVMDAEVIEDDVQTPHLGRIGGFDGFEQSQKQVGVLGLALGVDDRATVGIKGACEIAFAVLAGRRDSDLLAAPAPQSANARIEVDIGLVDVEHRRVVARSALQSPVGGHPCGLSWVADAQGRTCSTPYPVQTLEQTTDG